MLTIKLNVKKCILPLKISIGIAEGRTLLNTNSTGWEYSAAILTVLIYE